MKAFVGLGANLGDARAAVLRAIEAIGRLPRTRLVAASPLFRTAPVDAEGPDFINAVAEIDTDLSPSELLHALQAIENSGGRRRSVRNAPRTIDLDLLLYGDQVIAEPDLVVPHPRLHLRAFVLEPLAAIDPALVHPQLGDLAPWRARAADQRIERLE